MIGYEARRWGRPRWGKKFDFLTWDVVANCLPMLGKIGMLGGGRTFEE